MKYGDKVKDLLEEIDAVSNESSAETDSQVHSSTPEVPKEAYEYLEKTIQIQRKFDDLEKKYEDVQKSLNAILSKLDGYKNLEVSLSSADVAALREFPKALSNQVNARIEESAAKIKEDITKHADLTIKSVSEACDKKIESTKKELGTNKGIFLTWWNFWLMIAMTIYSVAYAVYAAFNRCLWGELWEILWLPFATLLLLGGSLGLIFYLNYREIRLPKL
jgi:hypothetical protein